MDLDNPSNENLKYLLDGLIQKLGVANKALFDPKDYDIDKYNDLKLMYEMVMQKGNLSASEIQAFINELRSVRKTS